MEEKLMFVALLLLLAAVLTGQSGDCYSTFNVITPASTVYPPGWLYWERVWISQPLYQWRYVDNWVLYRGCWINQPVLHNVLVANGYWVTRYHYTDGSWRDFQ